MWSKQKRKEKNGKIALVKKELKKAKKCAKGKNRDINVKKNGKIQLEVKIE